MPDGVIATVEHMADKQGQPLMGENGLAFEWSSGVEITGIVEPRINAHDGIDNDEEDLEENNREEDENDTSNSNSEVPKDSNEEINDSSVDDDDEEASASDDNIDDAAAKTRTQPWNTTAVTIMTIVKMKTTRRNLTRTTTKCRTNQTRQTHGLTTYGQTEGNSHALGSHKPLKTLPTQRHTGHSFYSTKGATTTT